MGDDSYLYLEVDRWKVKTWKNKDGEVHRLDGPAIEYTDGRKDWYQNGKLHRLDGPAVEKRNGNEEWRQYGKLHRLDGPAITNKGKYKMWYVYGRFHREDGPAYISINGYREWWLNDVEYGTKEKYLDALSDEAKMKCLFSEDFLNG